MPTTVRVPACVAGVSLGEACGARRAARATHGTFAAVVASGRTSGRAAMGASPAVGASPPPLMLRAIAQREIEEGGGAAAPHGRRHAPRGAYMRSHAFCGEPDRVGHLYVEAGRDAWRRRFVALKGPVLFIFASEEAARGKPLLTLSLHAAKVRRSGSAEGRKRLGCRFRRRVGPARGAEALARRA